MVLRAWAALAALVASSTSSGCGPSGPAIVVVEPACGPAGAEVAVRIRGRNLGPPRVDLGSGRASLYGASLAGTSLLAVAWNSPEELSAVVPPSVMPGMHALSVTDPQGRLLELASAYRVDCAGTTDGGVALDATDVPDDVAADPSPEGGSTLVFEDLFDTLRPEWVSDMNGMFGVSGGVLWLTPDFAGDIGIDLRPGTRPEVDYRVEARLVIGIVENPTLASAGILLRVGQMMRQENRYYYCALLASGAVSLDLYDNPARTAPVQLASAPIAGTVPGFTFDLYGIALGNRIRCGTSSAVPPVEVSVTDSFYPTGSWGIRALEASATFDSVRVYSPPP